MQTLARLATRGSGPDGKDTVDLIVGAGMKDNTLKPDTIYEIHDVFGTLMLIEIGPSAARTDVTPLNLWNCDISQIITCYRERWLLTLKEWQERLTRSKEQL